MATPEDQEAGNRLRLVEQQLHELQEHARSVDKKLATLNQIVADQSDVQPRTVSVPGKPGAKKSPPRKKKPPISLGTSEDWINRIGVGLLLLGLIFLFKYSIDKGWLTPPIRLVIGAAIGFVMCAFGLMIKDRRRLGHFLLGGGIAAFYITMFAGYQLYELISYPIAFAGMVAATAASYYFAVRENSVVSAVVATVGGMLTPFLLFNEDGSLVALVVYLCLIVCCGIGVFVYKGWRTLLLVTFVGGWLGLLAGWAIADIASVFSSGDGHTADRITFQIGIIVTLIAVGAMPIVRIMLEHRNPDRWPMANLVWFKNASLVQQPGHLFALAAPFAASGLTGQLWDMDGFIWFAIFAISAAIYAATYRPLALAGLSKSASVHGMVAALLACVAFTRLVDESHFTLVFFAFVGLFLAWLGLQLKDNGLRGLGHAIMVAVVFMLPDEIGMNNDRPPGVNIVALCTLASTVALFAVTRLDKNREVRIVYSFVAYVFFLSWLLEELNKFDNGQALVSTAWGLCGLALMIVSWRTGSRLIRLTGLGTLLIVLGKLFVVDLAALDAGYRILLFLGLGATLLALSYFFPQLWRIEENDSADGSPPTGETDSVTETES
ncbi:MAG: DUF2339 domain-containing protein [Rhodothermales bacterium]|nr:DUF2339 domain-containing protein [Rhodothermales bacterium]